MHSNFSAGGGVMFAIIFGINAPVSAQVSITEDTEWVDDDVPPEYVDGIGIASGVKLTITNCRLEMNSGEQIFMEGNGAGLILNNTTITSSDQNNNVTWKGIVVANIHFWGITEFPEQFSTLPSNIEDDEEAWEGELNIPVGTPDPNKNYTSYVLITGGEISYAEIGVSSGLGAVIRARGTDFIDNEKHIEMTPYTSGLNEELNACFFMGCTFKWTKDISAFSLNDLCGIYMWGVKGINIGGCNFINDINDEYCLDERGIGVYMWNSSAKVGTVGNTIVLDDMGCPKNGSSGSIGAGCNFQKLSCGVFYEAFSIDYQRLSVTDANFNNNLNGIKCNYAGSGRGNVKIMDNIFTSERTVISSFFESTCLTTTTMIEDVILNSMIHDIYKNKFTFTGTYHTSVKVTGSSRAGKIANNEFKNWTSSLTQFHHVLGLNISGINPSLKIYCNTFTDLGIDIQVASGVSVSNPLTGKSSGAYAGNKFSNVLTDRLRVNNLDMSNPLAYYVPSIPDPNYVVMQANPYSNNVTHITGSTPEEEDCELICSELESDYGLNVEQIFTSNSILLYPNPASNSVTLKSDSYINSIQIINSTGQVISTQELPPFENNLSIDIQNFADGVYFLVMYDVNGTRSTSKLFVSN